MLSSLSTSIFQAPSDSDTIAESLPLMTATAAILQRAPADLSAFSVVKAKLVLTLARFASLLASTFVDAGGRTTSHLNAHGTQRGQTASGALALGEQLRPTGSPSRPPV